MGGTMPVWGAVALAIGVALIAQIGALISQVLQRKYDRERRRSEEWHRNLRWAVELITDGDVVLGVGALDALDDAQHLAKEEQRLIDAILSTILDEEDEEDEEDEDIEPSHDYTELKQMDGGDPE